jgi:hypothetical protein
MQLIGTVNHAIDNPHDRARVYWCETTGGIFFSDNPDPEAEPQHLDDIPKCETADQARLAAFANFHGNRWGWEPTR